MTGATETPFEQQARWNAEALASAEREFGALTAAELAESLGAATTYPDMWFTGSSGYLDGARPVDLLETDPEVVVAAAAYQASLSRDD